MSATGPPGSRAYGQHLDGLVPSAERYCRSAAGARGSEATEASVRCNGEFASDRRNSGILFPP